MAIFEACLSCALNTFSSPTPKKIVFWLSGSSRLFPGFPLVSCCLLALFMLFLYSQPQSSPWDLTSNARASAPLCPVGGWGDKLIRLVSPGRQWSSVLGISLPCLLHPCCCFLLCGSEASPPIPRLHKCRGFLLSGSFYSFTAPSKRHRSCPFSFVCFSLFFCSTQVRGYFLAFWEDWGLLPAFSRCFAGVVPHVDIFFMYL